MPIFHDREAIPGMTKIMFSLTDKQLIWLVREAKDLGISRGELLRRLLDEIIAERTKAIT